MTGSILVSQSTSDPTKGKGGDSREIRKMKSTNVTNYSLEGDRTFLSFSAIWMSAVLGKKKKNNSQEGFRFKMKCKVTVPLRFNNGFPEAREGLE